jgi:putative Mg2+ transporter-C (MgtC) family protein
MDPALLTSVQTAPFLNLALAALFGGIIGIERTLAGKSAGMRTYALVALGSSLFITLTSIAVIQLVNIHVSVDPFHTISGIITGVGFIGAGMIFTQKENLHGLTSAAGLWIAAGVGIACGYGLFLISFFVTLLTLFIFTGGWIVEKWMKQTIKYTEDAPDKK